MRKPATTILGFPRIGEKRELKFAIEQFWRGEIAEDALHGIAKELRTSNFECYKAAGVDLIPCNDFSYYDQILDTSILVGNVPSRFRKDGVADLRTYFEIARGADHGDCGCSAAAACEMKKWFDTNYHYLVPEFDESLVFHLDARKVLGEFAEARESGLSARPVVVGPLSYLWLGKNSQVAGEGFDRLSLLDGLVEVYVELLQKLVDAGAEWVQIDEPVLSLDLPADMLAAFRRTYARFADRVPSAKLLLASYFGQYGENLETVVNLPVAGIHLDVTRSGDELWTLLGGIDAGKVVSVGIVDGRNVWRNDFRKSLDVLKKVRRVLGDDRLWVSSSCSLLHVPYSLGLEDNMDPRVRSWLAFAREKLDELVFLRDFLAWDAPLERYEENQAAHEDRRRAAVAEGLPDVGAVADSRPPFAVREEAQRTALGLPLVPTTTIGSFPQTSDVRGLRARWRKGELDDAGYRAALEDATRACIHAQEELGLDVLVHGEFERNDMVEFFGEKLDGFAITRFGWVQSYGTRCVKPPVLFGRVSRPQAMTVDWAIFAQSCTAKPVKGMLTGPVTILQWSFVRDDQARSQTAREIALAIREEVADLEAAGISIIQVDEAAFREGLPLRKSDQKDYLDWATEVFRLATSSVKDATQIHTHMCYSEFNDILDAVIALDADVITIEAARSRMRILDGFAQRAYPNAMGPGLFDIHSPVVPTVEVMLARLAKAAERIPLGRLWANPDCGLKTRGWRETKAALRNLNEAVEMFREKAAGRETAATPGCVG